MKTAARITASETSTKQADCESASLRYASDLMAHFILSLQAPFLSFAETGLAEDVPVERRLPRSR
ncbi:MAG: hypothetical protein ACAF41_19405 [Leptolyngbya sp. BL-A-14]